MSDNLMFDMNFTFQGGGAKLGALIAGADAVHGLKDTLGYNIASVAGASAGAIAAAILATGKPPSLFRQRIREIGPAFIEKVTPGENVLWWFIRAYPGFRLADRTALVTFLEQLFDVDGKKFEHVSDLPIPIRIYFTDMRSRKSDFYSQKDRLRLSDALADSAAIPFVFHSFRDSRDIVDGGLANNLPVKHFHDPGKIGQDRRVPEYVAFSFKDKGKLPKTSSFREYLVSLIATAIDSHVNEALELGGDGRVHPIDTDTGAFEFRKAIEKDLGANFERLREDAASFLKRFCHDKRKSYVAPNTDLLAERINAYYRALAAGQKVRVKSGVYRWSSYSLMRRAIDEPDFCDVELTIQAEEGSTVSVMGVTYLSGDAVVDLAHVSMSICDKSGEPVAYTVVPMIPEMAGARKDTPSLLLFFHAALQGADIYKIRYRILAEQVLYNLIVKEERQRDWVIYTAESELVESLTLVVDIPSGLNVALCALKDTPRPWPSWLEALGKKRLQDGAELTEEELRRLAPPPPGFKAIGWRIENLYKGASTGFLASEH